MERLATIAAHPLALESSESLGQRLAAAKNEITELESRRDALMKEVSAQQELENQLQSRNVNAVLSALRTGAWLPIGDARTAIADYVADTANTVQVGGVTLVMTPFGYFEYAPVVELSGSRAAASLVFHHLDFFSFGAVPAALRAGVAGGGLHVAASYREDSDSIAIAPDPQQSGVKDLTTTQAWRWTLTKSFRLFSNTSKGTFMLATPDGKGFAQISNTIEVHSWFGTAWEVIKEIWDVGSIVFAILAFIIGKKEWDTLIWRKLRTRMF